MGKKAVPDGGNIDREVISRADDDSAWESPIRVKRLVDREFLALSTNPQFLAIIEKARKEIRAGKTTSLESVERRFGLDGQKKRRKRARG